MDVTWINTYGLYVFSKKMHPLQNMSTFHEDDKVLDVQWKSTSTLYFKSCVTTIKIEYNKNSQIE